MLSARWSRSLGVGLLVCAVLALWSWRLLSYSLEYLGQGGLVHCDNAFLSNSLQQPRDGGIIEREPVVFGRNIDIAEANLFGRKRKLCTAVGTLALFDKAFFVQQEETPANHYRALCELFCNLC
jgi:hypothetical protein